VVAILWVVSRVLESRLAKDWSTDEVFLGVWFLGMLVGCVVAFSSGSARYLLPACAPLLLLIIRTDEQRPGSPRSFHFFYGSLLVVQVLLGLCLAQSDYEFAGTGRQEAMDFKARYLRTSEPFLFSGEWGLRYYLTSIGGEIAAEDTTSPPGRLMVISRLCLGRIFDSELGRSLVKLDERVYWIHSPFRLLDLHSHAGFWSDGWGVLPFSLSREDLDELSVYRVSGPP